jgi:hypothetical protein
MSDKTLLEMVDEIDMAVEAVDYDGTVEDDVHLANLLSEYWPELEPILRKHAQEAEAS